MKRLMFALLCLVSVSAAAEAHGPFAVRSRVVVATPVRAAVVVPQAVAVQAVVAQPSVTVINNRRGLFGRRSQQIIVQ